MGSGMLPEHSSPSHPHTQVNASLCREERTWERDPETLLSKRWTAHPLNQREERGRPTCYQHSVQKPESLIGWECKELAGCTSGKATDPLRSFSEGLHMSAR